MNIAFCIGNGESRKDLDLEQFKSHGKLYGSNAIHRDTVCDELVCCDKRMVQEALYSGYTGNIHTRPDWFADFATPQVKKLPDFVWDQQMHKWTKHFHWGSGLHAVHLACKQGADICIMIGHDFYSTEGKHNNIYKDTPNYWSSDHHAIDPSFWILQFNLLFATFFKTIFLFCQPNISDWRKPMSWDEISTVMFQDTKDMINDLHITQR